MLDSLRVRIELEADDDVTLQFKAFLQASGAVSGTRPTTVAALWESLTVHARLAMRAGKTKVAVDNAQQYLDAFARSTSQPIVQFGIQRSSSRVQLLVIITRSQPSTPLYTENPMRILLTNDDGIHAPGIAALHAAIHDMGEVVTIAPADAQSAAGHGITFHTPLMVAEVSPNAHMKGFAVDGRPADCVKVGLRRIWPDLFGDGALPDIVISGMNSGANVGINVIYSGTVAAAVESAFLGVPAIAVSLHIGGGAPHWRRAAEIARHAINQVMKHRIEPHSVININIPRTHTAECALPPMKVVTMNTAAGIDNYERRVSPAGQVYYWPSGDGMKFFHTKAGTDVEALNERFITITPLQYDLTNSESLAPWRDRLA